MKQSLHACICKTRQRQPGGLPSPSWAPLAHLARLRWWWLQCLPPGHCHCPLMPCHLCWWLQSSSTRVWSWRSAPAADSNRAFLAHSRCDNRVRRLLTQTRVHSPSAANSVHGPRCSEEEDGSPALLRRCQSCRSWRRRTFGASVMAPSGAPSADLPVECSAMVSQPSLALQTAQLRGIVKAAPSVCARPWPLAHHRLGQHALSNASSMHFRASCSSC